MKRIDPKIKIIVIAAIALTAVVVVAAVLIVCLKGATGSSSGFARISVNGVAAVADGDDYTAEIAQCDAVELDFSVEGDTAVDWFAADGMTPLDVADGIYIGGKDAELVYRFDGKRARRGRLTVKTVISSDEISEFRINGSSFTRSDGQLVFRLSDGALRIDSLVAAPFFTCRLYADEQRTVEVAVGSTVSRRRELWLDVYNVKYETVYKSYTVRIDAPDAARVASVTVNGVAAREDNGAFFVDVDRSPFLDMAVTLTDANAAFTVFGDGLRVDDVTRIPVDERVPTHAFTVKTMLGGRTVSETEVTVAFIYDGDSELRSASICGAECAIVGDAVFAYTARADRLDIRLIPSSPFARCELYFDRERTKRVPDPSYIDARDFATETQLFAVVLADNGDEREYIFNIRLEPSDACELKNLSVNGRRAELEDGVAEIKMLGGGDAAVALSDIVTSARATYAVYADAATEHEVADITNIRVTDAQTDIYIKVTAENGVDFAIYTLEITLVSNDNLLKGVAVNGCDFVITDVEQTVSVDHTDRISITNMIHDARASVSVYYDRLQTEPVDDLTDVRMENGSARLYIRVTSESADVKVYTLTVAVKSAPRVEFPTGRIELADRQKYIPLDALMSVDCGEYPPDSYTVSVEWNGAVQTSDRIAVENVARVYTLKATVSSPYFRSLEFVKSITVEPYVLRPVRATLLADTVETLGETATLRLGDIMSVDGGSYALGSDFYIMLYSDVGSATIADADKPVELALGSYTVRVCPVGDALDEAFTVGEISVTKRDASPTIDADALYELAPSGGTLEISELYSINADGCEILAVKTFVDGEEASALALASGRYSVRVTVLYNGGAVEKSFTVDVTDVSSCVDAEITVNGAPADISVGEPLRLSVGYGEDFMLAARPLSGKATVALSVNGAPASFGALALAEGDNDITITVTAESGATAVYALTVERAARRMPVIRTIDITVKLGEGQAHVDVAGCYSVSGMDYDVAATTVTCGGKAVYGGALPVDNADRIYTVVVTATGEFGAVEQSFTVGVLGYTDVRVSFAARSLDRADGYIFAASDFVAEVEYIGYDGAEWSLLIDGEPFTARTLADGRYTLTVRAVCGGLLIAERSEIFDITHSGAATTVTVRQKTGEVVLDERQASVDPAELFAVDSGAFEPTELETLYAVNGRLGYGTTLSVGRNEIEAIVREVGTQRELYRQSFVVIAKYRPTAEKIFAGITVNGAAVRIRGDRIVLISADPPERIDVAFAANAGFSALGLEGAYAIERGVTYIGYTAVGMGEEYSCALEVYNICEFGQYISAITYGGAPAIDSVIDASESGSFDIERLNVVVTDSRVEWTAQATAVADGIYDIRIFGDYGGEDIGSVVVRVFTRPFAPVLLDVILRLEGDGLVYHAINDYRIDAICVTDADGFAPSFVTADERYSVECALSGLEVGVNSRSFAVIDGDKRYSYEISVVLVPTVAVNRVSYGGGMLEAARQGVYTVDAAQLDFAEIDYALDPRLDFDGISCSSTAVTFNGATVGYDFTVEYDFTAVGTFSVALANDNASADVECDGAPLVQIGNDVFAYELAVDKATTAGRLVKTFRITTLYPYTTIAGDGIQKEYDWYSLEVDLGEISELETGERTERLRFTALTLDGNFEYTLELRLDVTCLDEANAPLVVTVNGKNKLLFSEAELDGYIVMSGKPLGADIFDGETFLTLGGTREWLFDDNGVTSAELRIAQVYDDYVQFYIVGDDGTRKHVMIYSEYVDAENGAIETAVTVNGGKYIFYENAPMREIEYNGATYEVLTADKALPPATVDGSVDASFYGYLAADGGYFVFADGSIGNSGTLNVIDGEILILINDYGEIVPYAVLQVDKGGA